MQENNGRKTGSAAFALVELVIVVLIIGILIAIAIPTYSRITKRTEQVAVEANLRLLDEAIMIYYATRGNYPVSDSATDDDGMAWIMNNPWVEDNPLASYVNKFDRVSGENYAIFGREYAREHAKVDVAGNRAFIVLEDGRIVGGHESAADERYYLANLPWKRYLAVAAPQTYSYDFSSYEPMSDFIYSTWGGGGPRHWSSNADGLFNPGENNQSHLFIANDKEEYTLTVNFRLNESDDNRGGFGLFFETALNENDNYRDSGYILQFDRGFSEIVLRKRVGGSESSTAGGAILARIGNRSTSDDPRNTSIPYRTDNDWWETDKKITLTVNNSSTEGEKLVTVTLDDEDILTGFAIDSNIEPAHNHTGFRAWNNGPLTVYNLNID